MIIRQISRTHRNEEIKLKLPFSLRQKQLGKKVKKFIRNSFHNSREEKMKKEMPRLKDKKLVGMKTRQD